jgi:hypothetical protein
MAQRGQQGCVDALAPFLVFAAFMTLFWVLARREGVGVDEWLRERNRAALTMPGWQLVWVGLCCALALGLLIIEGMTAIPAALALIAFGVLSAALLTYIGRRL